VSRIDCLGGDEMVFRFLIEDGENGKTNKEINGVGCSFTNLCANIVIIEHELEHLKRIVQDALNEASPDVRFKLTPLKKKKV
jgi:hypothetical protein